MLALLARNGTLSPSDSVGPVGPCGTLSPSDSDSVGPYGTLSPSDSVGPVGPYGTLSPSDTAAVGPVGPEGTLSSSDLAGLLFPAVPAGIPSPVGPIGPYGTLSPSDSDSVILVDPGGTLSSSGLVGIVVPDVSVELTIVPTGELSSVKAVPFPDPVIKQLPAERLVGDCGDDVNRDVTENSCWAVFIPGGMKKPAVVAVVGLDVRPMRKGVQLNGVDKCAEWDIRDEFETIDGMPVYYGGDLCTSDESDWEDPYDIVYAEYVEYVEQYNFDALEGMEMMVFERLNGPDESDVASDESVMMVRERTDSTHVRQTSPSYPRRELDTVDAEPVVDIFDEIHDVPDVAGSPSRRSYS